MNSTDFKAIEQYDVIEFQRDDDPEPRMASVDKDGDNAVLVGYVHTNNKGYWHTVTAQDVIRVVKPYNDTPGNAALREAVNNIDRAVKVALGLV